jgi:hypothetical protein
MSVKSEIVIKSVSVLASLGLTNDQIAALTKQGSICADVRSDGQVYYKLRFRLDGRQHVRYLGNVSEFVERVRAELGRLQHRARLRQQLGQLTRAAGRNLRAAKSRLEPLLGDAGFAFHGMAVRKRRSASRKIRTDNPF